MDSNVVKLMRWHTTWVFQNTRPQEKGAKALDLAKTGGIDKKDFEKARIYTFKHQTQRQGKNLKRLFLI